MNIPEQQTAVQLVGPDQLVLNTAKPVHKPGPFQLLCAVEACGLCFSDLKLLKQFANHPRKAEITGGISKEALAEMPHYVPGAKPTVPGHEAVVRVVATGPNVTRFAPGQRFLVQTDYRWLPTPNSNSAFGYNFEGALQQFVLMDERVITSPEGESMLIPAPEDIAASAIALCEPWACVEDAYSEPQRKSFKPDGRMLIVGQGNCHAPHALRCGPDSIPDGQFDDIVYFGSDPEVVETLFQRLATGGIFVIAQCGGAFPRAVTTPVGRIHYAGVRLVGTPGNDVNDALQVIPDTPELRPADSLLVIGAAGPMGTMHIIRALSAGIRGLTVCASDLSDERLQMLRKTVDPLARANNTTFVTVNPTKEQCRGPFSYTVIMVPVPALVAEAVNTAADRAIINIFAGIPADKTAPIDLNAYIRKRCYFVGTSGSTLNDMKTVLKKVAQRALDTNLSVAAVSGLDGTIEGIRAVERNLIPGKIIVYPFARGLGLTPLTGLTAGLEPVRQKLNNGVWTREAEQSLKTLFNMP